MSLMDAFNYAMFSMLVTATVGITLFMFGVIGIGVVFAAQPVAACIGFARGLHKN